MTEEVGGFEPQPKRAQVEPVTLIEGHVRIGNDIPDLNVGDRRLAAAYNTNVKSWLSVPGREAYYLTWAEETGDIPTGAQIGEGERRVSLGGTKDEYLLADPTDSTSIIGRYDFIQFPKVPTKSSMLVYRPAPDEELFHPEDDPSNPYELYEASRHAIDIVLDAASNASEESVELNMDPTTNQTKTGIMIDFEYGKPKYLWTPMGEVQIGRYIEYPKSDTALVDTFRQKGLHLEEFMPMRTTTGAYGGTFGPTYAVVGIGENELPQPALKPRGEYYPHDAADNAWEHFGDRYAKSQ